MGALARIWNDFKDTMNANADLKAALDQNDVDAALLAISHTNICERIYEDETLDIIQEYSEKPNCNLNILPVIREALYRHYDEKATPSFWKDLDQEYQHPEYKEDTGYTHPLLVYAMAAYNNDVEKLKELHANGIKPDSVSDSRWCKENIIMGCARHKAIAAMVEVIEEGASIDKNYGWDDFPPKHAFSKPLFLALHPGVEEALIKTGRQDIINEIKKANPDLKVIPGGKSPSP